MKLIEGVHKDHTMACRQEEKVPEIVERAGMSQSGSVGGTEWEEKQEVLRETGPLH